LDLRGRQHKFGPQTADGSGSEREISSVESREINHNRQAETGAGLCLIESLAAARHLLTLIRVETRPIVVDHDMDLRA
jgi:hypothetical protein